MFFRYLILSSLWFFAACDNAKDTDPNEIISRTIGTPTEKSPEIKREPDAKVSEPFSPPANLIAPLSADKSQSGLAWIILKEGEGKKSPAVDSKVQVRFSSWTADGTMFQKSRIKAPFKQRVGNLLKGWQEGIVKMRKGEIRRFWIPGKLAYDHDPSPDSHKGMLICDIELIDFEVSKR